MRTSLLLAALLSLAAPLFAQTAACSADKGDPFFYATSMGNEIWLHYETAAYAGLFSGSFLPMSKVTGNVITVQQIARVPQNGVPPACATGLVGLGNLPRGTYDVFWQLVLETDKSVVTTFRFSVDTPIAATIGPCEGGPADPFYSVTFSPVTIHEESTWGVFHVESVTIVGREITIRERRTVSGIPDLIPGDPLSCQRDSIPLGNLAPGTYNATLLYYPFVGVPPPVTDMAAVAAQPETPVATMYFTFSVPVLRPRAVRH